MIFHSNYTHQKGLCGVARRENIIPTFVYFFWSSLIFLYFPGEFLCVIASNNVPFERKSVCEFWELPEVSMEFLLLLGWRVGSKVDFLGLLLKCDLTKGPLHLSQEISNCVFDDLFLGCWIIHTAHLHRLYLPYVLPYVTLYLPYVPTDKYLKQ